MAANFNLSSFPSFSAQAVYAASVPEDLSVHSVVLRVGATDADLGVNAWIQYSLHGLGSHDFRIDPDTGLDNVEIIEMIMEAYSSNVKLPKKLPKTLVGMVI